MGNQRWLLAYKQGQSFDEVRVQLSLATRSKNSLLPPSLNNWWYVCTTYSFQDSDQWTDLFISALTLPTRLPRGFGRMKSSDGIRNHGTHCKRDTSPGNREVREQGLGLWAGVSTTATGTGLEPVLPPKLARGRTCVLPLLVLGQQLLHWTSCP